MLTAGSLKMQNPEARSGCAWCSPPDGLKAWANFPVIILSQASREAPTIKLVASKHPLKAGVSPASKSLSPSRYTSGPIEHTLSREREGSLLQTLVAEG